MHCLSYNLMRPVCGKGEGHRILQLLLYRKFCKQKLVSYSYSLHNDLNVTEGYRTSKA